MAITKAVSTEQKILIMQYSAPVINQHGYCNNSKPNFVLQKLVAAAWGSK